MYDYCIGSYTRLHGKPIGSKTDCPQCFAFVSVESPDNFLGGAYVQLHYPDRSFEALVKRTAAKVEQ